MMAQDDPAICEIRIKCRLLWAVMADRISVPGEPLCSPLPGLVPPAASLHYALRRRVGKTVMPLRNIRVASGFQPDNLGKTPEERRSLVELFSVTYEELRRLASSVKRSDPGATLSPTTNGQRGVGEAGKISRVRVDLATSLHLWQAVSWLLETGKP